MRKTATMRAVPENRSPNIPESFELLGQTITVEGVSYTWNGSKLKKQ